MVGENGVEKASREIFQAETPEERFKRLATQRTRKALKAIELLGRLARRRSYSYTDEQVSKIVTVLRKAVDDLENQFRGRKKAGGDFLL